MAGDITAELDEPAPKKKKSKGKSPTSRTLEVLRQKSGAVQIVEKWNPFAGIRQDLFGCIDIVYCNRETRKIIGVQATSDTNHNARINKSCAEPRLVEWLKCGGEFEVWSWGKRGARGKVKKWTSRVTRISLSSENRPVAEEPPVL